VLIIVVVLVAIGWDVFNDRKHYVISAEAISLYTDLSVKTSHLVPVAIVAPGEKLDVLRIRHENNAIRVKVETKDGKVGWLWLREGIKTLKR